VTLQLGADPLGLAAALGVPEEALWIALEGVVQVRGAGVTLDARVGGDGAAPLEFTPTVPGPVTMRLVLRGSGVSTVLGGEADLVAPLAAAGGASALIARIVASPDGWTLDIPLTPPGGAPGDPVLEIVPPLS